METKQNNYDPVEAVLEMVLPPGIRSEEAFENWFQPIKRDLEIATVKLYKEVEHALEVGKGKILADECCQRKIWELSSDQVHSLIKSTKSIRSKIARHFMKKENASQPLTQCTEDEIKEMVLSFPDLGRFRILCDFLHDLEKAPSILLSGSGRNTRLLKTYPVPGGVKDSIFDLNERKLYKGHRAKQFSAEVVESGQKYRIEIQLMTLLQQVWDRRNHPIYEWQREGGELPSRVVINDVALAEALYLVDNQAGLNWKEFIKIKGGAHRE